ncbi:MAG TPA: OmcA/MtrC family decaheme c-type cytochrome [Verrucomicrobiae bacterium]|nr:OmcA/MtrC family decaheme c-type cytochrome [Verrucomicrobiae bacterium]
MRIPSSVFAVGRTAAVLCLIAGTAALMSGDKNKAPLSPHEKAYYASTYLVNYVQPGLQFTIVSATVGSDGTISVHYKVSDPNGAPLDVTGVGTPGTVSVSYLAAYIAPGQAQFTSYFTRTATAATGSATATQASGDSGGTLQTVAMGEYIYTFHNKATSPNLTVTHRIGLYGSRNLSAFDLGTNYASTTYDFVPNGSKVTVVRDIVRTPDCNSCHDNLAFHGGSRVGVAICIMCHQPQSVDPNTGNTLDFPVMIHKIHMGSSLPSVQSGKPYQIVGYQNAVSDWSTVVYPADVRRCQTCHNPKNGAAQTNAWMTTPNRAACGACHDDVNFVTGANHNSLPQADDSQCASCHLPQGTQEFDASILGAHTIPENSVQISGLNFTLVKVQHNSPGLQPVVTFTVKDNKGNPIALSTLGSLSLTMVGPTTDYGLTNFGSDTTSTPGYVTESTVATSSNCGGDGTCVYTFTHPIPTGAKGTYAIGIEGRITQTIYPNSPVSQSVQYGGLNQVIYFSVDGSAVTPRRAPVALANCNNCHAKLEVHGSLRNNTVYCVFCHNPSNTDFTTRPTSVVASDKTLPNQAINLALMVHKIHTGTNLEVNFNQDYIIVGHGGSHNSFGAAYASVPSSIPNTGVRFPTMSPTGGVGDTTKCYMCHVNGSEQNLPVGLNAVTDPQGMLNPSPATTSACTACHLTASAVAHAKANTSPKFGESCDVCHGAAGAYAATQVHAGQ